MSAYAWHLSNSGQCPNAFLKFAGVRSYYQTEQQKNRSSNQRIYPYADFMIVPSRQIMALFLYVVPIQLFLHSMVLLIGLSAFFASFRQIQIFTFIKSDFRITQFKRRSTLFTYSFHTAYTPCSISSNNASLVIFFTHTPLR